jgi:F-type H+-transporting ATPase subunit epsilon
MRLEIVTPEKLVFSADVAMATLPGVEGEFGVLDNHAATVAELKSGEILVFDREGAAAKATFALANGGFAQVSAKGCTILSDDCKVVNNGFSAAADNVVDATSKLKK